MRELAQKNCKLCKLNEFLLQPIVNSVQWTAERMAMDGKKDSLEKLINRESVCVCCVWSLKVLERSFSHYMRFCLCVMLLVAWKICFELSGDFTFFSPLLWTTMTDVSALVVRPRRLFSRVSCRKSFWENYQISSSARVYLHLVAHMKLE